MNQVIINVANGKMTVTLDEPKEKTDETELMEKIMEEYHSRHPLSFPTPRELLRWLIETGRIKEDA